MASKLARKLVVAVLTFGVIAVGMPSSPSFAFSTVTPGVTTGFAVYSPVAEGLYLANIVTTGERLADPRYALTLEVPFFLYQSPLRIFNGAVQFMVAPTFLSYDYFGKASNVTGLYNTYFGSQISWDLGHGFGAGFRLDGYIPQGGTSALPYGTIEQRGGVSYTGHGYDLTLNVIHGQPQGDPTFGGRVSEPDYLNLDMTATKKFGKLELGAVAFTENDLTRSPSTGLQQSLVAVGGLASYDFGGGVSMQAKLTQEVTQRGYGGRETRGWLVLVVPLWVKPATPAAIKAIDRHS